jgi:hypothetical protein
VAYGDGRGSPSEDAGRPLSAVVEDPGAAKHERANAEAQKKRLGHRFRDAEPPAGDWTDNAFRLGKSLRRGYKRRGAVEVNVFGALGGRAWCRRLRSCSGGGLRLAVHPVFVGGCILPLCVHDLQ